MSPARKALMDMAAGRVTADAKKLAQVSRAVTNKAGGAIPNSKENGGGQQLSEEVEIREREMPDHLFTPTTPMSHQKTGVGPTVDTGYIQALMEGKGKDYKNNPAARQSNPAQPEKNDALAQANLLMESLEPKRPLPAAPAAPQLTESKLSSKEILTEVVVNLRKGGILKEEIMKVVLEEALTDKVMIPLMEKHFKRLMREFLAERKKA